MKPFLHSIGIVQERIEVKRISGLRTIPNDFLALTTKAKAVFQDETGKRVINPGTAIFVPAGHLHAYDPVDTNNWQNYWLTFDAGVIRHSFGEIIPVKSSVWPLKNTVRIEQNWREMYDGVISAIPKLRPYLFCLFHNILVDIYLQSNDINFVRNSSPISNSIRKMHDTIDEKEIDLKQLALSEGLGYDNFRKLFKKETGFSPKQYFLNIKINSAKSLLNSHSLNINQVAEKLGFDDPYYFSRIFKQAVGVSPSSYQKK